MKKLIIAATIAASSMAHAEYFSGNELFTKLTSGNSTELGYGMMYIAGVSDTAWGILHCTPVTATLGQLKDVVLTHMYSSPSTRHLSADTQVATALKQAFPCAAKKPTKGDYPL